MINSPGKTFDIYSIAEVVGQIYPKVFCQRNIVSGFEKTGICPFKRDVFTDDDFFGSFVSDRPNPMNKLTEESICTTDKVHTRQENLTTIQEDHDYTKP